MKCMAAFSSIGRSCRGQVLFASQTTQFGHLDNPYAGGAYHMYQNKPESWARAQKSVEEKGAEFLLTTTFTNLGGIIFIMGGGSLASKSGWLANYCIYLFAVLVLITVLALVPLNSLPIDDGQARAEIGKIKLNKYVFDCAGWAFCTMLLHNVLNNNISLFVAEEKLGSTAQAALTSTISLIGGMLSGFIVGKIGKKFPNSTIALAFFLYGLSYISIGLCNNIFGIFVGSFVVGAAMSIAMGQFAYLISIVVDPVSTSMVLVVYQAINSIGGVVSPFLVNSLTAVFHVNAFVVSGILALLLAAVALGGKFQKKLLAFAGM